MRRSLPSASFIAALAFAAPTESWAGDEPYLGEIATYSYNRGCPQGWHATDGAMVEVRRYEALYALIGTSYGGDGVLTFALPKLDPELAKNGQENGAHLSRCISLLGRFPPFE